jgi:DNA modification methylase
MTFEANKIYRGNALDVLKTWPDGCIKAVITSPPYWPAMRDYEVPPVMFGGQPGCDHAWQALPPLKHTSPGDVPVPGSIQSRRPNDKVNRVVLGSEWCGKCEAWRGQYGHEPIGQLYIEHSMLFLDEIWRVLADDGSLWWIVGDAHAGSGGAGGDWNNGKRANAVKWHGSRDVQTCVRDRSLFMTPSRLEATVVDAGWIVPNVIIWKKKVPYPYSGDRINEQYAAYSEKRIARQEVSADVRAPMTSLEAFLPS